MAERKVFVLVDNSDPANRALQWYLKELAKEKDELFLVHCAEYDYNIGLPGAAVDVDAVLQQATKRKDDIDLMMNCYMDQIRPHTHIKAKFKLLSGGKPGEEIIKIVEEEHPAILIMGSRGLGKIRRTILGSVSEYIVHHTPPFCSVTIVRTS